MNWMGGSRSRMIFKKERQKQREFFQKKKMKSQLKLLESSYPTKTSLSLDLLNLHVINQISKKKEESNPPQHADMCKRKETFSDVGRNVQLQMSPITVPSKICLDDSETISSQTKVKCRIEENSQDCITKQELKNEEKIDMTTEAKSKNYFHNESNENQTRTELEPEFQLCLYSKCASDNNGITSAADNITKDNKMKLPLQCSASYSSKLSLFEMQGDLSPNVSKLNKTGKRDVSVQCNFEREPTFIGYFHNNGIDAVNVPNNTANI